MKQVMFAGIAALCATVAVADGAIESSNVVGYQDIVVPNGYSMFTVTFKDTGATTHSYDLIEIKVLNSAGEEMNDDNSTTPTRRSRNKISVQKMDVNTGLLLDTDYKFTTLSSKGWCNGSTKLSAGEFVLQDGEGIAVTSGQGESVKFRVSGEVNLTPVSMAIPNGYSIIGNMTPNTIDLTQIKVLNSAGEEMNDDNSTTPTRRSRNKISVQKMDVNTGLLLDTDYKFTTLSGKGWCNGSTKLSLGDFTLAPGETVGVTSGQGDTVYFQFPAPISE